MTRTLTSFYLRSNPTGPRSLQPLDHLDGTDTGALRAYRHAVVACLVEAGHVGPEWVDLWGHEHCCWPEGPVDPLAPGLTDEQINAWYDALHRALAICGPLRPCSAVSA